MTARLADDASLARQRFRWATPRTALWVGGVTAVLLLAAVPLSIATHGPSANVLSVVFLPYGIVGFIVARRQPRNPIGWILLAISLAIALGAVAGQYALLYYREGDRGLPFAKVGVFLAASWIFMVVLLPLPIGLFPDGACRGGGALSCGSTWVSSRHWWRCSLRST
jgi:hypothetical protein